MAKTTIKTRFYCSKCGKGNLGVVHDEGFEYDYSRPSRKKCSGNVVSTCCESALLEYGTGKEVNEDTLRNYHTCVYARAVGEV